MINNLELSKGIDEIFIFISKLNKFMDESEKKGYYLKKRWSQCEQGKTPEVKLECVFRSLSQQHEAQFGVGVVSCQQRDDELRKELQTAMGWPGQLGGRPGPGPSGPGSSSRPGGGMPGFRKTG